MKRIILVLMMMGFALNAHAGLISIQTLSDDSQVSYTYLNTSFNTIKNEFNGGIDSDNIEDASIGIADMATAASPAQREGDHFNAYTKSGQQPVTDTDLTSDITAGVSYVKSDAGLLYRVATDATSKTYTASKDTWVYIDINGAFQYEEQALGAAQPTTPSNSLLLAKAVTDATKIASVVDWRVLSISLGTSDDFYSRGFRLLWDLAIDRLSVDSGVCYVGTTRIAKTSTTGLTISTAGDYISGSSDRTTEDFIFVYVDNEGNIKMDIIPPNRHDTAGNTVGILYYYYDGTEYWRVIGEFYLNATGSGNINGFYDLDGREVMHNIPLSVAGSGDLTPGEWTLAIACIKGIPDTSTLGIFGLECYDGDSESGTYIRPGGSNWTTNHSNGVYAEAGGTDPGGISGQRRCATDSSQKIDCYIEAGDDSHSNVYVEGYVRNYK